jgi:hypothetical protein
MATPATSERRDGPAVGNPSAVPASWRRRPRGRRRQPTVTLSASVRAGPPCVIRTAVRRASPSLTQAPRRRCARSAPLHRSTPGRPMRSDAEHRAILGPTRCRCTPYFALSLATISCLNHAVPHRCRSWLSTESVERYGIGATPAQAALDCPGDGCHSNRRTCHPSDSTSSSTSSF